MSLSRPSQPSGSILQTSYVVAELEQAIMHWVDTTHAGPFFLIEHLDIIDARYRGGNGDVDVSIALGFSGSVCIELIRQHDQAPSIFHEFTPAGGFHHWGIATGDFDNEIARYQLSGFPLIFRGAVAVGGRFAFMDTTRQMHGMIELIEETPVVLELFARIESASKNWDGTDPIRKT